VRASTAGAFPKEVPLTETADFALRLKDQVSRDANLAAGAMKRVTDGFNQAKRAADAFNPNTHWNKHRAQLDRVTKAQDELHMNARRREFEQQRLAERAARAFARRETIKEKKRQKQAEAADAFRTARRFEAQGFGGANLTGIGTGVAAATALAAAALTAAYAVGRVVYEFGRATLGAAAFAQDSKLAMAALLGDGELAARQFREVRFEAQALGLDVMGTTDQFRKLLSAQFDVKTSREIVRMSADLQVAGANVEKAILAISQIKMKGFLQGEELTGQLAEAGVSAELVYKRLEKQLGKTRKEILTMQKTGKIQADVAIEAIFGAVKDKTGVANFGDLARKRAETTLSGILAGTKARVQNFFIDVGEAVGPIVTPMAKKFAGLFTGLLNNNKLRLFGDRALEAFHRIGVWVDQNWPRIEGFIVSGFEAAVAGANQLFDAGEYLVENWYTLSTAFEGGMFWLQMFAVSAGLVAAPLIVVSGLAFGAAAAIAYLTGKFIEAIDTGKEFIDVAGKALSIASSGPLGIVGAAAQYAGEQIGSLVAPSVTTPPQLRSDFASPHVSPENISGAMGKSVSVGNIANEITVNGFEYNGDPQALGDDLANRMKREMHRFFEGLGD
jgi:tape measure domain-containing protein